MVATPQGRRRLKTVHFFGDEKHVKDVGKCRQEVMDKQSPECGRATYPEEERRMGARQYARPNAPRCIAKEVRERSLEMYARHGVRIKSAEPCKKPQAKKSEGELRPPNRSIPTARCLEAFQLYTQPMVSPYMTQKTREKQTSDEMTRDRSHCGYSPHRGHSNEMRVARNKRRTTDRNTNVTKNTKDQDPKDIPRRHALQGRPPQPNHIYQGQVAQDKNIKAQNTDILEKPIDQHHVGSRRPRSQSRQPHHSENNAKAQRNTDILKKLTDQHHAGNRRPRSQSRQPHHSENNAKAHRNTDILQKLIDQHHVGNRRPRSQSRQPHHSENLSNRLEPHGTLYRTYRGTINIEKNPTDHKSTDKAQPTSKVADESKSTNDTDSEVEKVIAPPKSNASVDNLNDTLHVPLERNPSVPADKENTIYAELPQLPLHLPLQRQLVDVTPFYEKTGSVTFGMVDANEQILYTPEYPEYTFHLTPMADTTVYIYGEDGEIASCTLPPSAGVPNEGRLSDAILYFNEQDEVRARCTLTASVVVPPEDRGSDTILFFNDEKEMIEDTFLSNLRPKKIKKY